MSASQSVNWSSLSSLQFEQLVCRARDAVMRQRLFQPQVACVLGSGLGGLADKVEHAQAVEYGSIPGFLKTHAAGHVGRLITGYLGGVPVVLMQGRSHRYEGHCKTSLQFPTHVMHALGARTLITTNAAGGLNSRFDVGDLMVIDSHIDFLWPRQLFSAGLDTRENRPAGLQGLILRGRNPYVHSLIRRVKAIARQQNAVLHQGCYLATLGPTYETRHEYRMFRTLGADAVGMSTIPEVLAARDLGMDVLAFSVITNVASTDVPNLTTHDEVVEAGNLAGPRLQRIIAQLLNEISGQPD